MKIISIINVKGGVGKSTIAHNIGCMLGHLDKRILFIDNDPQSNLSQVCKYDNFDGYSMYDLYSNKNVEVEDCIHPYRDNIHIIPNVIESAELESTIHGNRVKEYAIRNKFKDFRDKFESTYDYVIIDNSPFLGALTINSMVISDYYMSIIDNSIAATKGLNMVNQLVKDLKQYNWNSNINELGIIRNNWMKRSNYTKLVNNSIEQQLGERLFDTVVYRSVKYQEAYACNESIYEYSKRSSDDIKDLAKEFIRKLED